MTNNILSIVNLSYLWLKINGKRVFPFFRRGVFVFLSISWSSIAKQKAMWVPVFKMVIYLGVELLSHMVILCLTVWGAAELLCTEEWTILHAHWRCTKSSNFRIFLQTFTFLLQEIYTGGRSAVNHEGSTCCLRRQMIQPPVVFRDQSLSLREEDESLQTILASFKKWWLISDQGIWKLDFYWQPSALIFGSRSYPSLVDKYQSPEEWNESSVSQWQLGEPKPFSKQGGWTKQTKWNMLNWRIVGCNGKNIAFEGGRPGIRTTFGLGKSLHGRARVSLVPGMCVCAELNWKLWKTLLWPLKLACRHSSILKTLILI